MVSQTHTGTIDRLLPAEVAAEVRTLASRLLERAGQTADLPSAMLPAEIAVFPGSPDRIVVVVVGAQPVLPTPQDLECMTSLTRREAEVALLMAAGMSSKRIAQQFGFTVHTARRHAEQVLRKLGVARRTDVRAAILRAN